MANMIFTLIIPEYYGRNKPAVWLITARGEGQIVKVLTERGFKPHQYTLKESDFYTLEELGSVQK